MLFYVNEDWHNSYERHKLAQPETREMDYIRTEPHLAKVAAFGLFFLSSVIKIW